LTSDVPVAAAAGTGAAAGSPPTPGTLLAERGDRGAPDGEGTFDMAAHRCFACGDHNAQGIRMAIHVEPDRSWCDLALEPAFQGWEGIAHGGILATLLDEAMAWAVASRETFAVTARMTIDYRRPVQVGAMLRVEGRVTQAKRRLIRAEADVLDARSGATCAHAEGVYVTLPDDQQRELRARYRFSGAADGPSGERRWRVRQTLPPVDAGSALVSDVTSSPPGGPEGDTPDLGATS
jgi:uncharacterized protein (TIGR00369 family)